MGKGTSDTFINPVVKYVLFFYNFLFWLIGGAMIGIGAWAFEEKNRFQQVAVETVFDIIFDISIVFIAIGIITFVLGFAGCVGALRENCCLLKFFYIALLIIFLLQMVGAVLIFVFKDKVKTSLVDAMNENLVTRYHDDQDSQNLIDWFQENLYCCGVGPTGYLDWNNNLYFNCTPENKSPLKCSVPWSCCKTPDSLTPGVLNIMCGGDVLNDAKSTTTIYTLGCIDTIILLMEDNWPIVGGIVVGLAVPQLVGIFLGRCLESQIKDQLARQSYRR